MKKNPLSLGRVPQRLFFPAQGDQIASSASELRSPLLVSSDAPAPLLPLVRCEAVRRLLSPVPLARAGGTPDGGGRGGNAHVAVPVARRIFCIIRRRLV